MKITCQACAAKYTIADEKVFGKVVKIRCKKCGATIVVNGNESAAAPQAAAGQAFDYAGQGPSADEWTVNVADGDQRTMSTGQIVEACRAGVVTDDTFCWKDGMSDWMALRDIEDLYAQCGGTRVAPGTPYPGTDDGETKIQQSAPALFAAAQQPGRPVPAAGNGAFADAAPLAARRAGGRAGADLFSGAAQAGSEEDVMTSAPAGMPQAHDDGAGLTGARNENSVLFSLNALTSNVGPPRPIAGSASSEASGLIDIRQLSNQLGMGEDRKKRSRVDDIMNLGGGGAFAPAMGAPVLAAPPIEDYAPSPDATAAGTTAMAAQGRSRALIFGAIGAGALVIAGAIGTAVALMRGSDSDATDKTAASASAAAASALAANAAPTDTAAAAAAAPTDTTAAANATATAAPPAATRAAPEAPAAPKPAAAAPTSPPTPKPAAPAAAPTPPPAVTPPAPAAAADQPFNMGEAKSRLAGIAGGVQSCKKGDATGTGRVVVTFAPNGGTQSAVVSGGGFDGTPTGACVAGRFRGARVPPFSGSPFAVAKSFTIN